MVVLILIASVIVWFLSYYPRTDETAGTETHYANSYLGRLGKGCELVFSPLGFNWKASVALLSGLPALAFLVFILLYVPCIATVVAIGSEAGWKWAAASVVYNTAMAWLVAWIVYRIVLLF